MPGPDQDDGEIVDFSGLDEGQGFKEFIQGAEPAGKDNEGRGVADEHEFPCEEVPEGHGHVQIGIQRLLARRFSIRPGPPPVMTANPASPNRAPIARAAV